MKESFVYILSNKRYGALYVGVTTNLIRRINEHKNDAVPGFTRKYRIKNLIYYEIYDDVMMAINREKQIKRWKRAWKIALIEKNNPLWCDLFNEITS